MSRDTVIAAATAYLESGLIANDLERIPLAADCIRIENGWDTGKNRTEILATMPRIPALGNLRWLVEQQECLALWDIIRPDGYKPIFEYFRVSRGLLKDIRANSEAPHAKSNALGPARAWSAITLPAQRRLPQPKAVLQVCARYFQGLVAHEVQRLPLGSDVTITENGRMSAYGIEAVGHWLREGMLGSLRRIRVLRWLVDGDQVGALYEAQMEGERMLVGTQYFRVYAGKIRELSAVYGVGPSPAEVAIFERGEHKAASRSQSTRPL